MDKQDVLRGMKRGKVLLDVGIPDYHHVLGMRNPITVEQSIIRELLDEGLIEMDRKSIPGPPLRFVLTDKKEAHNDTGR